MTVAMTSVIGGLLAAFLLGFGVGVLFRAAKNFIEGIFTD